MAHTLELILISIFMLGAFLAGMACADKPMIINHESQTDHAIERCMSIKGTIVISQWEKNNKEHFSCIEGPQSLTKEDLLK